MNLIDPTGQQSVAGFAYTSCVATGGSDCDGLHREVIRSEGKGVRQGSAAVIGSIPIGRGAVAGVGFGARAIGAAALRRGASKSFGGASKFVTKTIGQLGKTGGSSGTRTSQTFAGGGQKAADKLFKTLTKGNKTKVNSNGSFGGQLKDGSIVNMSTNAKGVTSVRVTQGTATTGSRIKKTIKVRFKKDAD